MASWPALGFCRCMQASLRLLPGSSLARRFRGVSPGDTGSVPSPFRRQLTDHLPRKPVWPPRPTGASGCRPLACSLPLLHGITHKLREDRHTDRPLTQSLARRIISDIRGISRCPHDLGSFCPDSDWSPGSQGGSSLGSPSAAAGPRSTHTGPLSPAGKHNVQKKSPCWESRCFFPFFVKLSDCV